MLAHHDDPSSRRESPARLRRRAEFLRVGKGRRWHGTAMTLQTEARETPAGAIDEGPARFGFTLTRKIGNAVMRNRARRRLREAVRLAPDLPARAGHDYVIVGRVEAIRLPLEALVRELTRGLAAVHERGKRRDGGSQVPSGRSRGGKSDAKPHNAKPHNAKPHNAQPPGRPAPERTRPEP